MRTIRALLACLPLLALAAGAATPPRLLGLDAEGGDIRAELSDGSVLHGADLVGAVLRFDGLELKLDAVRRDDAVPEAPPAHLAGDVWLFRLLARRSGGAWGEYCTPDAEGERVALVLPAEPGRFAFTCASSASGRCIRMGYRPWAKTAEGQALAPFHAACVHLLRAAYGGDEQAFAREDMPVALFDRLGIQPSTAARDQPFEAGWAEDGAVCVAHPRMPQAGSLSDILRHVPRLVGRTGPASCDETRAAALGALVFSRSAPRGP